MKFIVVFFGIAAVVVAEKQGPYPPSGWKPDGPQLTYPPPTPSNEYGPATTAAPTEPPTQAPQEPPSTYIPSDENSGQNGAGSNGYQRYQNQRFTSQASAQLNQGSGQFFIITPQGQLQHIPINVPEPNNRDAEVVETQPSDRRSSFGRLSQPSSSSQVSQRRQNSAEKPKSNENQRGQLRQPSQSDAGFPSITPDGRLESVQANQRSQSSARVTSAVPSQAQTQFVAFIPAVPLDRVQSAAMVQAVAPQNGQYHVIYPNGKLQRVQYMNVLGANNRLTANVQYQEVDPIRGPLYTFGSPLVRVL